MAATAPATADDDRSGADAASADSDVAYGAVFNPFEGTAGVVILTTAQDAQPASGDWALGAFTALLGAAGISALIRKLVG